MVHGTIVTVERKKRGRLGVVSGRVGGTLFFTRLDLSLTFFHTAVTIAPFIGHFVLPASNRLCCHSISYQKKVLMQNTTDFYRYFLRVSNVNSYQKRAIETKSMQSSVVYMTTLNIIMVVFQKSHTKPGLNNMVLVTIDSPKGSLQTAS